MTVAKAARLLGSMFRERGVLKSCFIRRKNVWRESPRSVNDQETALSGVATCWRQWPVGMALIVRMPALGSYAMTRKRWQPRSSSLEAWLLQTSVNYHTNVRVSILLNRWLALAMLRATGTGNHEFAYVINKETINSARTACVFFHFHAFVWRKSRPTMRRVSTWRREKDCLFICNPFVPVWSWHNYFSC